MGIKIGNIDASYFKVGSGDCSIYLGDTKLYPTAQPSYKFQATYSDSTTYDALCDGDTALTTATTRAHTTPYSAMTTAIIGDCITKIGGEIIGNTFRGCKSLTSVTIPNTVTIIGSYSFQGCSSLTSVNLPSGLTQLSGYLFSDCTNLRHLDIPTSVTSILNYALSNTRLLDINIPSGVTNIAANALWYNNSLSSITVNALTPPTLGGNAFDRTNDCQIYVPCQSVDAYKSATNWSSYASRIQGIPPCKQWVSYYEGDSVPNYGVYGIKFQSSASHEYVETPAYIGFIDGNNNYINIYYDSVWYIETSSGAEEITFDGETDYATIIFDDYGVGAATIDEIVLFSTGMPFDMELYELN